MSLVELGTSVDFHSEADIDVDNAVNLLDMASLRRSACVSVRSDSVFVDESKFFGD